MGNAIKKIGRDTAKHMFQLHGDQAASAESGIRLLREPPQMSLRPSYELLNNGDA